MQFLDRLKAEGPSLARQAGYVQRLTSIAVVLGKDFDKAMPAIYVRLSGRDIDNRLLELHGLKPKRIVVDVSW
jgi:hypothetical protein